MKIGIGLSRAKDVQEAIQAAHRSALQDLQALKADFLLFAYTYDFALEPDLLSSVVRRNFKSVAHAGFSTWSGWKGSELFEGESGVMVLAFKDLPQEPKIFKVHSLKEKADLWSAEMIRRLEAEEVEERSEKDSLMLIADSIHFTAGRGFERIREHFPKLLSFGFGTSYGIPQCSVLVDGELFPNTMLGIYLPELRPYLALLQSVEPESQPIHINRMSENLLIEIDEKPAFYRLSEHLMATDDLPMMAPDEFRKHMGNLYIIERPDKAQSSENIVGEAHRIVSLLGSEMTTGMVAVGDSLDFERKHYLGQKKLEYSEDLAEKRLRELKEKIASPSLILNFSSSMRFRDNDRRVNDPSLIEKVFPQTPLFGVSSNGEFLQDLNQQASLVVAFP